jgi:general secretion pathway protein G
MRILWCLIVVLGLLSIPLLCHSQSTLHRAHRKRAVTDIRMLMLALEDFATSHENRYPKDLDELFGKDANNNPYLVPFKGHIPKDGWGHPFAYELPTEGHPRARLLSYGSDGERGGTGDAEDVDSDTIPKER